MKLKSYKPEQNLGLFSLYIQKANGSIRGVIKSAGTKNCKGHGSGDKVYNEEKTGQMSKINESYHAEGVSDCTGGYSF